MYTPLHLNHMALNDPCKLTKSSNAVNNGGVLKCIHIYLLIILLK